jgi:TetR/AcrR family transcriptional regulator, regulator of cefoperazone and chloramphenicol sensitivity
MRIYRQNGINTREKLLKAASEVFAVKSYRDTTVAEICEKAQANIAAVNYHFNDKETLYRESWRYAFSESIRTYPPDGGIGENAPPDHRLRGQILALLHRIADDKNKEFAIAQKELVNPTGLLDEVIREELGPMHDRAEAVVRELLGPEALDADVHFCVVSVINQCVNPIVTRRQETSELAKPNQGPPIIGDIDAFADHVTKFSLAGIAAIRVGKDKTITKKKVRQKTT